MAKNGNGKNKGTGLAVISHTEYALANTGLDQLPTLLKANMGAQGIDMSMLDCIKVPAGGALSWEVPTLGGIESTQELVGVVIHWRNTRRYWKVGLDESESTNAPPDCVSDDTVSGYGDPGGICKDCPFSQWGSGKNEKGQACQLRYQLFMIRENNILPMWIDLAPTSIKPMGQHFARLTSFGKAFYQVVTKLTLEKDKNDDGKAYSRVVPSVASGLDDKAIEFFSSCANIYEPYFERAQTPVPKEPEKTE